MSLDTAAHKGARVQQQQTKSQKADAKEHHAPSRNRTGQTRTDSAEPKKKGAGKQFRKHRRKTSAKFRQQDGAAKTSIENSIDETAGSTGTSERTQEGRQNFKSASAEKTSHKGASPHFKGGHIDGRPKKNSIEEPTRNTPVYSAIDLGTNNCRLLIAKPTRHGFRVIDAFSRIVRLGEGVAHDNRLSDEAMDRTIDALKVCAEKLARRNVTCMRNVATEACRIATNSDEFVARVRRETGINLDVISPGEEARLAVLGCQSLIAGDKRNALVFDIGGGSTELIWVSVRPGKENRIKGWMSVPWGVVNLTEKFTKPGKPLSKKRYQKMIDAVQGHLEAFDAAHNLQSVLKGRAAQFLGTSGTVTTIASLHLKLPKYVREKVDGAWMRSSDVIRLSRKVAEMTGDERAAEPCIGTERADLVVAGCAILEAILAMWQVPSLRVADRGIREGILRSLMQLDTPVRPSKKRYRGSRGGKKHKGNPKPKAAE